MTLDVLRWDQRRQMPWANGGGVTYELARMPADANLADFDWRISVADVAGDGPFSTLPDVDRIIMLIDGPWLALTVDGTRHLLHPYEAFAFSGDSATECEVPSATRDLNVMLRRGRFTGSVEVLTPGILRAVQVSGGARSIIVCLTGSVQVTSATQRVDLSAMDSVSGSGADPLTVTGVGTIAAVHLHQATAHDRTQAGAAPRHCPSVGS